MDEMGIKILWEEFHVPKNIRKHMEKVAEISVKIGKKLIEKGVPLNLKLLRQAALLHDLAKIVTCFDNFEYGKLDETIKVEDLDVWNTLSIKYEGLKDPEITALVLSQKGEKELADITRKHHFTSVIEEGNEPKTWEEKVLYYADKLVLHDKEVTLKERLKDLDKRYGKGKESPGIREAKKKAAAIEDEILSKIKQSAK